MKPRQHPEQHLTPAAACEAALYGLVARLRPDLRADDARDEVQLTLDDFERRLDGAQPPVDQAAAASGRRRGHLWALPIAAALSSGGYAVQRAAVTWQQLGGAS